jgi:hypothetical protein
MVGETGSQTYFRKISDINQKARKTADYRARIGSGPSELTQFNAQ